jgi:hypothetical protein
MNTTEKVRENRLRRMADRQGLRLVKSPRRDPRALGYGTYRLVGPQANSTSGALTIDEIETLLTGTPVNR